MTDCGPEAVELSVVIPTYNRGHLVWRAIESVLRGGSVSLEVIVVDDGSDDGTEEVVTSRGHRQVRYIHVDHAGVSHARNVGARSARGRWLAFLDSDDEVLTGWADTMLDHLKAGANVVICGGEFVDDGGLPAWSWIPALSEAGANRSLADGFLAGAFALERELFWRVGGYHESLTFGENTELALRLMASGDGLIADSVRQVLVRRHAGTPSPSYSKARVDSARYVVGQHAWLRWRLPTLWASYHAILGVDCAREGVWREARRHFFQAAMARPGFRHSGRLLMSCIPPVAARVWRPSAGERGHGDGQPDRGALHILLVIPEYPPAQTGGIASYAHDLAAGLSDLGHDVEILVVHRDQRVEDITDGAVRVHRRPQVRIIPGSRRYKRLRHIEDSSPVQRLAHALSCRREQARLAGPFDVIEACDWMAGALFLIKPHGRGLVVHAHGSYRLVERRGDPSLAARTSEWLEARAIRRADVVTVPSPWMCDFVESQLRFSAAVRIVPCPTEVRAGPPEPVPRPPVVLYVGRLDWLKAPEVLVQAGFLLRERVPGTEIVFVGNSHGRRNDKAYGAWLAEVAKEAGSPCRFVGPVARSAVLELMASASVVVVPSRFEAFGLTAAEALGQGTPVVCTDTSGIRFFVSPPAGIAVPFGDSEALANALECFLPGGKFASEAPAAALNVARANFARRVVANKKVDCYVEAIRT